jgi:hypothetical protein
VRFEGMMFTMARPIASILRCIVRAYQIFLGPILPRTCRFHPSCSAYALEALRLHGAVGGSWLAARRLLRCHPWGEGGFDPVPESRTRA